MVQRGEWQQGRYPALVKWLAEMHAAGAQLCSPCSGVLLLAETALLDGKVATVHWIYAPTFRRNFPTCGCDLTGRWSPKLKSFEQRRGFWRRPRKSLNLGARLGWSTLQSRPFALYSGRVTTNRS